MSSSENKLTLKSFDNEVFIVEEAVAAQSEMIKNMIQDNCASSTIPLPNVDAKTLALLLEYCKKHADETAKDDDLEKWDSEFVKKDQSVLYNLIMAANYLNIKKLLDRLCLQVADMIRGKQPPEIREIFHIKNDFTAEEEEEIRQENAWAFE